MENAGEGEVRGDGNRSVVEGSAGTDGGGVEETEDLEDEDRVRGDGEDDKTCDREVGLFGGAVGAGSAKEIEDDDKDGGAGRVEEGGGGGEDGALTRGAASLTLLVAAAFSLAAGTLLEMGPALRMGAAVGVRPA